jgi:hypothetical protein
VPVFFHSRWENLTAQNQIANGNPDVLGRATAS